MNSFAAALLSIAFLPCQLSQSAQAQCPLPFVNEAGHCVFVNTAQSYSWCSANQQCASIGGELINRNDSLKLFGSMSSANCSCYLWVGVTDMAEERDTSRSGWQRINDNGILNTEDTLWKDGDPTNSGGTQDCISQIRMTMPGKLLDLQCSDLRGFACEFTAAASQLTQSVGAWQQIPFKRNNYNPSSEYCYADLLQVKNSVHCVAAAMRAGNGRRALYNSKLRRCRLLLFSDAQVEQEIETSPDWVKFSV